jgi:hypothetical protein
MQFVKENRVLKIIIFIITIWAVTNSILLFAIIYMNIKNLELWNKQIIINKDIGNFKYSQKIFNKNVDDKVLINLQ